MSHPGEAAFHVVKAEKAWNGFNAAMMAFRAELMRGDRTAQEEERVRVLSAVEVYLDELMAANAISGGLI